jgi:hypothetical protein
MKHGSKIEALIDRLVKIEIFDVEPTLNHKISLLSLVLEELKHERQIPEGLIDFETYVQCEVLADKDTISVTTPIFAKQLGTGTASIRLQAPLLLFLLLNHGRRLSVSEIVEGFIAKVRPHLSYLDFKKTKSGAPRCFANARLAAHTLHSYGLLKYTWQEGYKSWQLSLAGLLAAADIFKRRSPEADQWSIPPHFKEFHFDLRPEVRRGCDDIGSFEAFVSRLASICRPDATVFKTHEAALQKSYLLLTAYWVVLNNSNLNRKERRAAGAERIRQLEREVVTDAFYEEFSRAIQVSEMSAKTPAVVAA